MPMYCPIEGCENRTSRRDKPCFKCKNKTYKIPARKVATPNCKSGNCGLPKKGSVKPIDLTKIRKKNNFKPIRQRTGKVIKLDRLYSLEKSRRLEALHFNVCCQVCGRSTGYIDGCHIIAGRSPKHTIKAWFFACRDCHMDFEAYRMTKFVKSAIFVVVMYYLWLHANESEHIKQVYQKRVDEADKLGVAFDPSDHNFSTDIDFSVY